jgi:hypothetical protein
MTLFQVAPSLWAQLDGWQCKHQAKISVEFKL